MGPGSFWRPPSLSRDKPEVSAHIWFPNSWVLLSSWLPTYAGNNHTREGKRKNLGVVQFLAPDLLDSHPLGLPWAWQVCQHPGKYRKSDTANSAPAHSHPVPGIQLSCIRTPGLEHWETDQESGDSRNNEAAKLHLYFLHPVSLCTCWQQLPSSFLCGERVPGPLHMLLLHQVPGLQAIYKSFRVEL